jgi:hypothetical protein
MKIKTGGRAGLMLAAWLLVCFAAPSLAAAAADGATSVRYHRHYVHHRSTKPVLKSADSKSDSKKEPATDALGNGGVDPATLSPAVANANAQLAAAGILADSARAMTARANDIMQAAADAQPAPESGVVAPDQLNDVDRALREGTTPPAQITMASAEPPAAPAPPVMASSESASWNQTSLIGKIFIGFGALLTLASAARMFMA